MPNPLPNYTARRVWANMGSELLVWRQQQLTATKSPSLNAVPGLSDVEGPEKYVKIRLRRTDFVSTNCVTRTPPPPRSPGMRTSLHPKGPQCCSQTRCSNEIRRCDF